MFPAFSGILGQAIKVTLISLNNSRVNIATCLFFIVSNIEVKSVLLLHRILGIIVDKSFSKIRFVFKNFVL